MPINNTSRTAGPFIGNGITTSFPFSYKVFDRTDVLVAQTVTATNVETVKTLDAHYSVTLNSDQNNNPGGVITMFVAPPVGTTLAATSNIPLVQSLDLTNQGGFYPTVINDALDRLVMNVQQLAGKIGNGLGIGMSAITDQALAALVLVQQFGGSTGSSLLGFLQSGTGAVAQTAEFKLQQEISNLDFLPQAERAAVLAGTSTYDATAAMQAAIDAAGSTRRLRWLGVVNTRALSSSASVDWEFEAGAKIKQIPVAYGAGSWHVSLTGPSIRIKDAEFDGNQDAMSAGQGSNGLLVSGASPTLVNVRAHDYAGRGYDCNSVNVGLRRGLHIGCSFDDNAGLGLMTTAASYLDFTNCTFDRNGYGFQKHRADYADTSHGFIAFGLAIRLRSHHINFTTCCARDNGRDGFNVNQGSYAVKFSQCLAAGNDDGGFTVAADNTGSGLPGESEACYDIEYVDCEAYNNYSSGLVIYQAANNVRVDGGRYYNNHRLAGNQPAASSYYNGVYFAGGSTGLNIDTCVYDDRQSRVIAAVAGNVITATGWVAGDRTYYPKVAVYAGADQSFRGYASITAESSGSVTISPTPYNGVVLNTIVPGDYITQAVQHNGVFADNACQGLIAVDGAGERPGSMNGITGRMVFSGSFASGQNILLPKERLSQTELLANPSFDVDVSNWAFNIPGGGSAAYFTGLPKRSIGGLQLVAGAGAVDGDAVLVPGALSAITGGFIEYGGWVYASARNDAYITFYWVISGVTLHTLVQHPGGGWRYLKIGLLVPDGTTDVTARVSASPGKTVYFDSMSLRAVELHADSREFAFPSRSLPL